MKMQAKLQLAAATDTIELILLDNLIIPRSLSYGAFLATDVRDLIRTPFTRFSWEFRVSYCISSYFIIHITIFLPVAGCGSNA